MFTKDINYADIAFDTDNAGAKKELGRGGYGVVYQGTWQHVSVAVKQLLIDKMTPELQQEFETESQMMAGLRHDNIVQFRGYCTSP